MHITYFFIILLSFNIKYYVLQEYKSQKGRIAVFSFDIIILYRVIHHAYSARIFFQYNVVIQNLIF